MIELIKLLLNDTRTNLTFLVNLLIIGCFLLFVFSFVAGVITQCGVEIIKQFFAMKTSAEMSKLNNIKENESK